MSRNGVAYSQFGKAIDPLGIPAHRGPDAMAHPLAFTNAVLGMSPGELAITVSKGLTIVVIYILLELGFSPFGCKTLFLTSEYWYIPQLIIFLTVYVIIFIAGSQSADVGIGLPPLQLFGYALVVLVMFNVVSRLGETWAFFRPVPYTWFGVVLLPILLIYLLNKTEQYMMRRLALAKKVEDDQPQVGLEKAVAVVKFAQRGLVGLVIVSTLWGYWRAYRVARRFSKRFDFIKFFFGIPQHGFMCSKKTSRLFDKEVRQRRQLNLPWLL